MFVPVPLELKYAGAKTTPPAANAVLILINVLVYLRTFDRDELNRCPRL